MRIVFCKWTSICEQSVEKALKNLGHEVIKITQLFSSVDYDQDYIDTLSNILINNNVDLVFSINYIPIVSRVCNIFKLPYASWTVDCPCFQLYSHTIHNSCNRIFLFDKLQYNKFVSENPNNIFYLPLASDINTYGNLTISPEEYNKYHCDISFIGSLYSEKCRYNSIKKLPAYIRGFVDGLVEAQTNVYGYNFIEDSLTSSFIEDFKSYVQWDLCDDYNEDSKGIIADTYIGYKCTEQDRIKTLNALSCYFDLDLYTLSDVKELPKVHFKGGADSKTMMPKIFKCSKINLNMTSRPIKSGIPLRFFDILASGGFLMSNYQSEIPEYFQPDKDIVLYESIDDLINKVDYYLKNDDLRLEIARNGHQKAVLEHSFETRLSVLLSLALTPL